MARTADSTKDQLLLNLLRRNARTPLSEIAKELGVTRATAQARLSRLEREGHIGGYTIVSGGEEHAQALFAVMLVELELRSQAHVVAELKKIPEIVSCFTLSGQFDLLVRIRCRLPSELDEVIDRVAQIEGVRRTTSSILLSRKFER